MTVPAKTKKSGVRMRLERFKETMLDFPLFILTSPFKGFDEMKSMDRGSMFYCILILIIYGLVSVWSITGMGFVVTGFFWEIPSINIFWVMFYTYAPIALICVANWSITSITDGNGRLKDIFQTYCYALFPVIIFTSIAIVFSNFITTEEAAFVTVFNALGQVALYFYLFIGLIVVHEYTLFKAIGMVLLTVLAMLVIVFVLMLFVSLVSELIVFIAALVVEAEAHLF